MFKRHLAVLAAAAAFVTTVGAAPAFAAEGASGPGEAFNYDCEYLGITVGRAQISVGGRTDVSGEKVLPLVVFAKTDPMFVLFPIKDKYVSWWNPEKKLSLGTDLNADEGRKRRKERHRFDRANGKATVTRDREGQPREEVVYDTDVNAQDILAAFFTLRERQLNVGDVEELPVFTGKRTFMMRAQVDKKETIKVPAGTFETKSIRVSVQFSGKLESKRDIVINVTDDGRNMPVRISADLLLGSVEARLTSFEKGAGR
ncbi:MAG: DUF3108 domain-containing protein [Myxococcales bacterium]